MPRLREKVLPQMRAHKPLAKVSDALNARACDDRGLQELTVWSEWWNDDGKQFFRSESLHSSASAVYNHRQAPIYCPPNRRLIF